MCLSRAEHQVKLRLARDDELKMLKTQQLQVQADINRSEFKLNDYRGYRDFLEALIPEPLRSERQAKLKTTKDEKRKKKESEINTCASVVNSRSTLKTSKPHLIQ